MTATLSQTAPTARSAAPVSRALVFLLATACGVAVANVYYAQPLVGPISAALGLSVEAAGLIVTMTQIGYVLGLLFIVPLGDLVENRRLVVTVLTFCSAALLTASLCTHALPFLVTMMVIGLTSVVVQILIPYSAHLAPEGMQGRVVGTVTSGLMIGIMLSRPMASFITHESAWNVVFMLSAIATAVLAACLMRFLPQRRPPAGLRYGGLLLSMARLALTTPVLRRRAAYQFCIYLSFSLFWTTVPLLLAGPAFGFSQAGIACFGLAAVAGAVAAPLSGTLADKGMGRFATGTGIVAVAMAFPLSRLGQGGSWSGLALLTLAAVLLDFGVSSTLVVSQRTIFALSAAHRSRYNGIFMAMFFIGGALGSAVGAWAYARGGWIASSWIGFALPLIALLIFATEFRRR